MIDTFFEARELLKEALAEGIKSNHSACDMYYAVLARRNDAALLTCDLSLAEICRKLKIEVMH